MPFMDGTLLIYGTWHIFSRHVALIGPGWQLIDYKYYQNAVITLTRDKSKTFSNIYYKPSKYKFVFTCTY